MRDADCAPTRRSVARTTQILQALLLGTGLGTALMIPGVPVPALAQDALRRIEIPALPLAEALARLGDQTGLQIGFSTADVAGRVSPALSGAIRPEDALRRLLSGSGLSASFVGTRTVSIVADQDAGVLAGDAPPGAVVLAPVAVGGGRVGADYSPALDFSTPDAVANVDRELLEHAPQVSTGDLLRGITGVGAGDNRNSGGMQANVRGAQGHGRVKVTVDGSEGSSLANRGYGGMSDTTFVDPDFIAGFSVNKGPTIDGGGAIGGTIRMRTFAASDLLRDGRTWALRFRTSIGDNAKDGSDSIGACISSNPLSCANNPAVFVAGPERFAGIPGHDISASLVGAWRPNDRWDFVFGVSKRESGNYRAGTRGKTVELAPPTVFHGPGDEVQGSYKSSDSLMFKARFTPTADHEVNFGFNRYRNLYADRRTFAPGDSSLDIRYPLPSTVDQKRYTLSHRWRPEGLAWVDLKSELWLVRTDEQRTNFGQRSEAENRGIRIANRSEIALPWSTAILTTGAQYRKENVLWTERISGSDGILYDQQKLYGIYASLEMPVTSWLTFNAGLRKDWYDTRRLKTASNSSASTLAMTRDSAGNGSSYNLGFVLEPADGVQLYGRYSKGWRAPSMMESLPNTQGVGWVMPGTVAMVPRPETSRNVELGVNYTGDSVFRADDSLGLKLGYFDNRYSDYIVGTIFPASRNLTRMNYRGFEASARYDTGRFYVQYSATKYIRRNGCGFSVLNHVQNCRDLSPADGLEIYSVFAPPELSQSLTVGGRFFDDRLDMGVTASRYVGTKVFNFATNNTMAGNMTTVDLFASFALNDSTKISASVSNLTDRFFYDSGTQHYASVPGPGRTIRLSLTRDF